MKSLVRLSDYTVEEVYEIEEVSEDVINSKFFVGYEFKKHLLEIQQAIMIYSILHK